MIAKTLTRIVSRTALIGVLVSTTASAGVWDRALSDPDEQTKQERYDAKMLEGDTAAMAATLQSSSVRNVLAAIARSEKAYRDAASERPREAEPYFRIAQLLYQLHFACEQQVRLPTCEPQYASPKRMEDTVDAWNAFEARAPLDPRVDEMLVKRALLNTRLVDGTSRDHDHLRAAAHDYEAALDRADGLSGQIADEQVLGNLAETYMMLDRLDDSIATYQRAVAVGAARTSTVYGLAVALDRDGSSDRALQIIQDQRVDGLETFNQDYYIRKSVFFVPAGEADYYFALANEAFGNYGVALELWNRFVASGAHPEYQPRAKEHIEQLRKRKVRPQQPTIDSDEPNW